MKTNYSFRDCIYSSLIFLLLLSVTNSYAQIGKCKGKYFGNIVQSSVRSDYGTYWNQATSENGSKWGSIEGNKGVYNFNNSDLGYNWAKNNNGLFKFHTLVWGAQTPGWVASASTATLTASVQDFIKACSTHYTPMGGLALIDVLNEPVNTAMPGNLKAALTAGYQAEPANANDKNNQYGWAIWCFQLARKYFPNSKLLINEYNVEMNWNNCRAPYIAMAIAIKNAPNLTNGQKNLIDGVGLQAHGVDNLTAANFKACLDEIWTKTGLPIHITEFDQTANPNEAKQQAVYSSLIPVAWEHAHVEGITLWGYVQGTTWINGNGVAGASGTDSGIKYANGTERPALIWLKQYMAGRPNVAGCGTNIAPTVSITNPLNNATFTSPATIAIAANAADADGTISNVQFYNGTTLLGSDATTPYTFSWTSVAAGTYTITARATDNSGAITTSSVVTVVVNAPPITQTPFSGTPALIPGKIEAEEYDLGGEGVSFHETTTGNSGNATLRGTDPVDIETTTDDGGGINVGWIAAGEWLEYTVNVTAAGTYSLDARVAAQAASTFHVEMNGVNISGTITVPNTGGFQTFQTVTINNISLTAGQKIMRIVMDASYFNINSVTFRSPLPNVSPSVSLTAPIDSAVYDAPANITINATAADTDGSISNVQFYNGTTLLGSDVTSPYSYSWIGVVAGTYSITARATDNSGAVTTSTAVTIVVNPSLNTPPTVSISSPLNNASFIAPASITINATAADADGTVSSVQFYNGTTLLGSDATSPYSFSWTGVLAGTYTITARAADNSGAITTSTAVTIIVNPAPNTAPTVSIISPLNNANFFAPASITINASATDADGTVSTVQFYNGSTLLGSDATSPYSFSWTGVAVGTYSITARATDNSGSITTSAVLTVIVTTASIADIIGPDCGSNNGTLSFQVNPTKRANVTSYNWWYTGSVASTVAVAGAPYSAAIQTGAHFSSGQVCVGMNLNVAPWYIQYCKTITKCAARYGTLEELDIESVALTVVSPNPSSEGFDVSFKESAKSITINNMLGSKVYSAENIDVSNLKFGNEFPAGLYIMNIEYISGHKESVKIQKIK